jgi:hypothetical protein
MKLSVPCAARVSLFVVTSICLLTAAFAVVTPQRRAKKSTTIKSTDGASTTPTAKRSAWEGGAAKVTDAVTTQATSDVMTVQNSGWSSQNIRKLTGEYKAEIAYPDERISGTAEVKITGNEFRIKTGEGSQETELSGIISALKSQGGTTVALNILKPDGTREGLSLKLTRIGNSYSLTNVKEEDKAFSLVISCPDPPGCMESDLCRPTCSK